MILIRADDGSVGTDNRMNILHAPRTRRANYRGLYGERRVALLPSRIAHQENSSGFPSQSTWL